MKQFLLLILVLAFQFVQAQAPDPDFNDKMAKSESRFQQKSAAFTEADDYSGFDLIYQRLDFSVDPAVNYISGSVYSLAKILENNVVQIRFDLADGMTVDSVWYNDSKIGFLHSGDKISIELPESLPKDSIVSVQVFYRGAPQKTGFESFTVTKHSDVPVLWTLSEPYGARDWWPCKQSLADKIDSLDVFVTCPLQYKTASNGKLISDVASGSLRTAHWKHRFPIATYLVGIAVTNYEAYSNFLDMDDGSKIEVLNYVYPEYLNQAKTSEENILNILALYNSKFITYPFASEKYGHAQFSWGGGMEHQTMSFMTSLDFELVAHEMAHQWFGDYVTLASWHDIWLNEGFATYLAGLAYENLLDGYYWPIWKNYEVNRITSVPNGSVYVDDTTNVSRIFDGRLSYSKGAYLLHSLRWEMGDEQFFKGMKDYLLDPEIANGFASQEKFVRHMETAADTSFTEFFNDWYYGQGYPVYDLHFYTDFGDFGKVKLHVNQSSSDPSVSFFEMHLPLRVWKSDQSKDLRLYNTVQGQEFVISEEPIDSVQFDPDKWLIAKADKVSSLVPVKKREQIQIFPEYALNQIRVVVPDFSGNATLRIFDTEGRLVLKTDLLQSDSRINISLLQNGLYLVEVNSKQFKQAAKIIISR
ncbi:MAG: M1 family aminopeptidase [Prolixibacteraceae bacterium]|jgi:aminopeptidase N